MGRFTFTNPEHVAKWLSAWPKRHSEALRVLCRLNPGWKGAANEAAGILKANKEKA